MGRGAVNLEQLQKHTVGECFTSLLRRIRAKIPPCRRWKFNIWGAYLNFCCCFDTCYTLLVIGKIKREKSSSTHLLIRSRDRLSFSEQLVHLPLHRVRRAALGLMCNADETFAANVLGSDWVKESTALRRPHAAMKVWVPCSDGGSRWHPGRGGDFRLLLRRDRWATVSCPKSVLNVRDDSLNYTTFHARRSHSSQHLCSPFHSVGLTRVVICTYL